MSIPNVKNLLLLLVYHITDYAFNFIVISVLVIGR